MITPTRDTINAFLHFGWLPRTDAPPPIPIDWIPQQQRLEASDATKGAEILRAAVSKTVPKSDRIVVPLSGGLDSRAMTSILVELGHNPITATLGTPGTYDYDIGKTVAKETGLEHVAINVNELPLTTDMLVAHARRIGDWANVVEIAYNLHIADQFPEYRIISGFLGDFLAGSYARFQNKSWHESVREFAADAAVSRQHPLTEPGFNVEHMLPDTSTIAINSVLSPYEELVLTARHTCSMRPTLFTGCEQFITPFRDKDWVSYILSAPVSERDTMDLYKKILTKNWETFFSLPTKTNKGLPLSTERRLPWLYKNVRRTRGKFRKLFPQTGDTLFGIDAMENYTNFHVQFRSNTHLRTIASENIADLASRQILPWLPLKEIHKTYLDDTQYISPAVACQILTLTNLEINLKAAE